MSLWSIAHSPCQRRYLSISFHWPADLQSQLASQHSRGTEHTTFARRAQWLTHLLHATAAVTSSVNKGALSPPSCTSTATQSAHHHLSQGNVHAASQWQCTALVAATHCLPSETGADIVQKVHC